MPRWGKKNADDPPADPFLYLDLNMAAKPFKRPATVKPSKKLPKGKSLRQVLNAEKALNLPLNVPTFTSIEAPPSLLPHTKYCDVTGLLAPYTVRDRGIRFHDEHIYQYIKTLDQAIVNAYLTLRNAGPKF